MERAWPPWPWPLHGPWVRERSEKITRSHQDKKGKSGTEYLGEAMLRRKFITNIFSHISVGCVGLKL